MRMQWTSPKANLMFDKEQAYRFVSTLTDAGRALTWGNTQANASISKDEMDILKELDSRLQMNPMPDYVTYKRPKGAKLLGE